MATTYQDVAEPRPGDVANHVDGHDGREVTRVSEGSGALIWLDILGTEHGPFPTSNYTFRRPVER